MVNDSVVSELGFQLVASRSLSLSVIIDRDYFVYPGAAVFPARLRFNGK